MIGTRNARRGSQTQGFDVEVGEEDEETVNPIVHSSKKVGSSTFSALSQNEEGDIEMKMSKSYKPLIEEGKISDKAVTFSEPPSYSHETQHTQSQSYKPISPREKVIAFYKQYNPEKLPTINDILSRYQGKEQELLTKLHKQYNIPTDENSTFH